MKGIISLVFMCCLCTVSAQHMNIHTSNGVDTYPIAPGDHMTMPPVMYTSLNISIDQFPATMRTIHIKRYDFPNDNTTDTDTSNQSIPYHYTRTFPNLSRRADTVIGSEPNPFNFDYTLNLLRGSTNGIYRAEIVCDPVYFRIDTISIYNLGGSGGLGAAGRFSFSAKDLPYTIEKGVITIDMNGGALVGHEIKIMQDESIIQTFGPPWPDVTDEQYAGITSFLPFTDDSHLVITITP